MVNGTPGIEVSHAREGCLGLQLCVMRPSQREGKGENRGDRRKKSEVFILF